MVQNLETKYGASVKPSRGMFSESEPELVKVVGTLQTSVVEVLSRMQEEIRSKERELAVLRASTSQAATSRLAIANGGSSTPFRSPLKANLDSSAGLVTPTKRSDSGQEMVAWSAIKSAIKSSPSANGASRLHAELVKEVSVYVATLMMKLTPHALQKKKMHSMEEEHTELLGLLAQQEIELSVYRQALVEKVGEQEAISISRDAQESVAKMYGAYTNIRDL